MTEGPFESLPRRALGRSLILVGNVPGSAALSARVHLAIAHWAAGQFIRLPDVVAVDVRGSTVRRDIRLGQSDIDLHVVIRDLPGAQAARWLHDFWAHFAHVRRVVPLLSHVYVLTEAEKKAAAIFGVPFAVGENGAFLRLQGRPEPAVLRGRRRKEHIFASAWFASQLVLRFYPRVLFVPRGQRRPMFERRQSLLALRHCAAVRSATSPDDCSYTAVALRRRQREPASLQRLLTRAQRQSLRRRLWVAPPRSYYCGQFADSLQLASSLSETRSAESARLQASTEPWDEVGTRQPPIYADPERVSDYVAALRRRLRHIPGAEVFVARGAWQCFDNCCHIVLEKPPTAEQIDRIGRDVRSVVASHPRAWRAGYFATYPVPVVTTRAMWAMRTLFSKRLLEGGPAPIPSQWMLGLVPALGRASEEHALWVHVLTHVELLRRKWLEIGEGKVWRLAGRLIDWTLGIFPGARLLAEHRLLVVDRESILRTYAERFTDPTASALVDAHRRLTSLVPEDVDADLLGGLYDELYPTLHDISARIVRRLLEDGPPC